MCKGCTYLSSFSLKSKGAKSQMCILNILVNAFSISKNSRKLSMLLECVSRGRWTCYALFVLPHCCPNMFFSQLFTMLSKNSPSLASFCRLFWFCTSHIHLFEHILGDLWEIGKDSFGKTKAALPTSHRSSWLGPNIWNMLTILKPSVYKGPYTNTGVHSNFYLSKLFA